MSNAGEAGDDRQRQKRYQRDPGQDRLDGGEIGELPDQGGEHPAQAEGESHHEARHHGPPFGRQGLGHDHADGKGRQHRRAGQGRTKVDPAALQLQEEVQNRRHDGVGEEEHGLESDPVRHVAGKQAAGRSGQGK